MSQPPTAPPKQIVVDGIALAFIPAIAFGLVGVVNDLLPFATDACAGLVLKFVEAGDAAFVQKHQHFDEEVMFQIGLGLEMFPNAQHDSIFGVLLIYRLCHGRRALIR